MKNFFATSLIALLTGLPTGVIAAQPAAVVQHKTDPAATANAVLDDLDAGRYDAVHARFTTEMALAVSTYQLKTVWVSLPLQFGKFQHRGTARVENQNGMTIVTVPLAFERFALEAIITSQADGRIAGFLVRPAPAPALAPRPDLPSREVAFGPANRTQLPGTLLLPKGKGPFPAVVFVHGSGPSDRDESLGGTRVFRDFADGLADRGIASLRYEKRTRQHPLEFNNAFTIDDETTNDAVAAAAFLRTQADIDPKRIYIVGHSQGAMMAPRIAQRAPGLAGLVLLAAPARHLQYLVLDQFTYLAAHDPAQGETIKYQLPLLREKVAALDHIDPKLPAFQPLLNNLPAGYWRDLGHYNQVEVAQSLHLPILIEQGERDFQVTAPDWARWQMAFGNDPRVTIHHYPALNHMFVAGDGYSLPAEYARPAHVDPKVIADVADWIKTH